VGASKMAVFDDMEATEKVRIYDKGVGGATTGGMLEYQDALTLRFGDILIPALTRRGPLELECKDFVSAIRDRRPPKASGRDGLKVVQVLEAASHSLAGGGSPVKIQPHTPAPAPPPPAPSRRREHSAGELMSERMVHPDAVVAPDVTLGAFVVIEAGARV